MTTETGSQVLIDPDRWGLPAEAIERLPTALQEFWQRYRHHFRNSTRDPAPYAYHYLSALLRMKAKRYFAEIGREVGVPGENIQHFTSNSPWSARPIYQQIQAEIAAIPALHGGALLIDDSADAKSGPHSAGASRQYNGRLGKVDLCQSGVFLAYFTGHTWAWVDAELYLPEEWFAPERAEDRKRAGIPAEWVFQTKPELAQQMIERARQNGLPFSFVACDDTYGRKEDFRSWLNQEGILYLADVPASPQVYLERPHWGIPNPSRRSRKPPRPRVLPPSRPVTVRQVAQDPQTLWQTLQVRPTERGELVAEFAARRVWTLRDGKPTEEWLMMRRESDGTVRYALSDAPADTPLSRLAEMEAARYFAERTIQDAKSEAGFDEFRAIKWRAWEHQAVLTALSLWFIAQVRLEWAERYPRDAALAQELGVELLPALSVANVRELLRAVMPLRQLTPEEARRLVVQHLVHRARSRRSRLKKAMRLTPYPREPAK